MKELTALQSVLNTLGVKVMDDRMDKVFEAKFYCIEFCSGRVNLQGEYTNYIVSCIAKAFPNAESRLDTDSGYVKMRFVSDAIIFNVCLT